MGISLTALASTALLPLDRDWPEEDAAKTPAPARLEKAGLTPSSHPRRSSSSASIVQHLVEVHHRLAGERLHELEVLFDGVARLTVLDSDRCRKAAEMFRQFKEELDECLMHEQYVVFPHIEQFAAASGEQPGTSPSAELLELAGGLATWHANLLVKCWKLVRRVSDFEPAESQRQIVGELQSVLAAFCDDFQQQLFEEDCLLLPRITNWQPQYKQQRGCLCPQA